MHWIKQLNVVESWYYGNRRNRYLDWEYGWNWPRIVLYSQKLTLANKLLFPVSLTFFILLNTACLKDIINQFYMYALHNSNAILQHSMIAEVFLLGRLFLNSRLIFSDDLIRWPTIICIRISFTATFFLTDCTEINKINLCWNPLIKLLTQLRTIRSNIAGIKFSHHIDVITWQQ